jgi:hypothetical protein
LFYTINARLNIRLLRKRQLYAVFAGQKPIYPDLAARIQG